MTVPRHSSPYDLCHFQFADGRQCYMPAVSNGFCKSHDAVNRLRRTPVEEDLYSELTPFFGDIGSHIDLRGALERIFKALSANRITHRRAATFGYLAQVILLAKHDAEQVSTQELHDMYNFVSNALRATYSRKPARADLAPPSAPSSEPSLEAPAPRSGGNGRST